MKLVLSYSQPTVNQFCIWSDWSSLVTREANSWRPRLLWKKLRYNLQGTQIKWLRGLGHENAFFLFVWGSRTLFFYSGEFFSPIKGNKFYRWRLDIKMHFKTPMSKLLLYYWHFDNWNNWDRQCFFQEGYPFNQLMIRQPISKFISPVSQYFILK